MLGAAGGVLGLVVADTLVRLLLAAAPSGLPRLDVVAVGGAPVPITIGVTLVAVFGFGLFPTFAAARGDIEPQLRLDARSGTQSRSRRRVRQWLVASQVALALVMIAGAGLLARSLDKLQRVRLGYDAERLAIFEMTFRIVPARRTSRW